MKNLKRAVRRHHRQRLIKKRANHWGWGTWGLRDGSSMPARLYNKVVDTPCDCSCSMCGNVRRHHNEITKAEYRNWLDFKEQCEEVNYDVHYHKRQYRSYY